MDVGYLHKGCSTALSINILMQRPVVPILLQHSTAHLPDQGEGFAGLPVCQLDSS